MAVLFQCMTKFTTNKKKKNLKKCIKTSSLNNLHDVGIKNTQAKRQATFGCTWKISWMTWEFGHSKGLMISFRFKQRHHSWTRCSQR